MAKKYVLGPNAARKFAALLRGSGEVSRRQGSTVALAFDSEYVAPFTVQWAQSANEGEGSWIIWLPTDELVVIPEGSIDPSAELDDVGGEYPEGWYLLDEEMLDPDEGGTLYLNVSIGGGSTSALFSSAPAAATGDEFDVPICTASVNSTTGERKVRQFVTSAIVVGGGDGDNDTRYGCDERSISLIQTMDAEAPVTGNRFYLAGFGKFTVQGAAAPYGTFAPATESEIALDGDTTTFAVLCRTGNSTAADANFLSYKKLKIVDSSGSSPFKYEKSTTTSGGQTVTTHKLVNCKFYWNGVLQSLADFDVSGILSGGSVYLRGNQAAPSAQTPEPTWTWTLGTSEAQAASGGKVLNYKLYDFAQSKISVDYRTTFLALEDHTQKARFTVAKSGGGGSIVLDASGEKPKLVISDGTKSVTIDLADIASNCGGTYGLHSFSYKDKNGDTQIYHGLFCDDIDLSNIAGTALDKAFSVNGTKVADISASANINITEKTLSAGTGISLSVNGNVITISATGGGGSTSGYSTEANSPRKILADADYDMTDPQHPKLRRRYIEETWDDGLLKTSTLKPWEAYHEPVEETVTAGGS